MKTPVRTQLQNSIFLIVFPLCYILIGALFQFVPDITPRVVSIILSICIVIVGAVMIARYFLQSSFRDLYSYDFSFGAFAVIAGVCMMIAATSIGDSLITLLGVCMLMTSIIKVQNAIQLISMKKKTWIPVMVIAVLLIAADVLVLIKPFDGEVWKTYTNFLLMTDGVFSFVINVLMSVHARKRERAMSVVTADGVPVGTGAVNPSDTASAAQPVQPAQPVRRDVSDKPNRADKAEKSGKSEKSAVSADKPATKEAKPQSDRPAAQTEGKGTSPDDDGIKELFDSRKQ